MNCSCSSLRILHTYELQLRYIQVLRDKNNDMKSSKLSLSIHVIYCKLNIYRNMRCSGSVSEPIVLEQLYTNPIPFRLTSIRRSKISRVHTDFSMVSHRFSLYVERSTALHTRNTRRKIYGRIRHLP